MTKTFCDACNKVINPFKSRELSTEWFDADSAQWVSYYGDLCQECYEERERLHAKLDTLILNHCVDDLDGSKADSVRKLLESVEMWKNYADDSDGDLGGTYGE